MLRFMEVADFEGRHIGIVDEIEGGRIALLNPDPTATRWARYVGVECIDRITNTCIVLKRDAPQPEQVYQASSRISLAAQD